MGKSNRMHIVGLWPAESGYHKQAMARIAQRSVVGIWEVPSGTAAAAAPPPRTPKEIPRNPKQGGGAVPKQPRIDILSEKERGARKPQNSKRSKMVERTLQHRSETSATPAKSSRAASFGR